MCQADDEPPAEEFSGSDSDGDAWACVFFFFFSLGCCRYEKLISCGRELDRAEQTVSRLFGLTPLDPNRSDLLRGLARKHYVPCSGFCVGLQSLRAVLELVGSSWVL